MTYKQRVGELGLFSLERRRLREFQRVINKSELILLGRALQNGKTQQLQILT